MAGLYAILQGGDEKRLGAIELRLRFSNERSVKVVDGVAFAWIGHDDPERYAPAYDPKSGVRLATSGRLAWTSREVHRAKEIPYHGGLHNRLLLERYLHGGANAVAPYNGASLVMVWDPRDRILHLWTDQFGYHPTFLYKADSADAVITTFPDALLGDSAIHVTSDETSMAEFLRAWRTTPPHTYYREVKHAGSATHHRWNLATREHFAETYWRPFERDWFSSFSEAAEALAGAVVDAIRERTAASQRPVFFVSGGADSRVLLFAADAPGLAAGINLFERPTFESETARRLCERAGVQYVGFQRDNDYYPRLLLDHARWSGAMWSEEDGHYLGVVDLVRELGGDLVMTACTTDWVFKGYGLERTSRRLFGRALPFKEFLSDRVDCFLPNYARPAQPCFADQISVRWNEWFADLPTKLETQRDFALVEDRRIRPACYTVSVSGQIMYRVFPYDTFLADSRIADCYSRIPPKWKLNGEVWSAAASRVCKEAGDILDSNYGWSLDAGAVARLTAFARGWIGRRLPFSKKAATVVEDGRPPSSASWPELGWYALHSDTLRKFWNSATRSERTRMTDLWGASPWDMPLEVWAGASNDLFRILTLLAHWRVTQT